MVESHLLGSASHFGAQLCQPISFPCIAPVCRGDRASSPPCRNAQAARLLRSRASPWRPLLARPRHAHHALRPHPPRRCPRARRPARPPPLRRQRAYMFHPCDSVVLVALINCVHFHVVIGRVAGTLQREAPCRRRRAVPRCTGPVSMRAHRAVVVEGGCDLRQHVAGTRRGRGNGLERAAARQLLRRVLHLHAHCV